MSERRTKIYIQTTTKFKEKKEKRLEWDNNKQTKKKQDNEWHIHISDVVTLIVIVKTRMPTIAEQRIKGIEFGL